jgi:hypothetical protein
MADNTIANRWKSSKEDRRARSIFGAVRKLPSCIPYAIGALSVSLPAAHAAALEARDWTRGEPSSFKDLIADAIGVAAVVALAAVADR